MNNTLRKVNSHQNPLRFQNTLLLSHKCVMRNWRNANKKVYILPSGILFYLVKSDTRVLFV
jgi:hypothetical protein